MRSRSLLSFLAVLIAVNASAQLTGSFSKIIIFNSQQRNAECFVPSSYVSSNQYSLVIGMHGCGGPTASAMRDELQFLSDSINAIVVCPQGLQSQSGQMAGADIGVIKVAIDSILANYNIDTNSVYIFGFSCNGYTALTDGMHQVNFNYKGIIAFDAYLLGSDFVDGSFDYNATTPSCICTGTADPYHAQSLRLADSLAANSTPYLLNVIPGLGHTTSFPAFKEELMKCFSYFSAALSVEDIEENISMINLYPNPASDRVLIALSKPVTPIGYTLSVFDISGRKVVDDLQLLTATSTLVVNDLANGIYVLSVREGASVCYKRLVVAK